MVEGTPGIVVAVGLGHLSFWAGGRRPAVVAEIRMKLRLIWAAVFFATFLLGATAHSQAPDSSREDIKRLIVRIDSTFSDKTGFGAGIVFGMQNDQIYIVTANHVVRDGEKAAQQTRVQFRGQKEQLTARLATHYDVDRDLGVIVVTNAKAHGIDSNTFQFDRVGDPSALTQVDPVYLAGHPQVIPWSVTVTPDGFI
jgi:S1-C subfamily serine protease